MYAIKWTSKITGHTGSGLYILDRETGQKTCDRVNKDYPDIKHWIEEGEPED